MDDYQTFVKEERARYHASALRVLGFDVEDFEPDGVFGSRGIRPEVADGAFHRYWQDRQIAEDKVFNLPGLKPDKDEQKAIKKYAKRCTRLATKAPGMLMRRFPVPGADSFIFNEQRPDWAIWTGDVLFPYWMNGIPRPHRHDDIFPVDDPDARAGHVGRGRDTPEAVFRGTAWRLGEYDVLVEEAKHLGPPNYGADHFGDDTDEPHVHVKIAKYVFTPNARDWVTDPDGPHDHAEYHNYERRVLHEAFWHAASGEARDGVVRSWNAEANSVDRHNPDAGRFRWLYLDYPRQDDVAGEHEHYREEDVTHYAARLSWHPYKREERWQRDRVMFALEGCLKETALVSAGEATFSCPSVTLWNAPELQPFAEQHLRGKVVYVVCDSDWNPAVRRLHDDKVIWQALMVRDTLIRYGVDARVASPPQPIEAGCTEGHDKHGVDDHLGPCNPLGVDDLLEVQVTPQSNLELWLRRKRYGQPGNWRKGLENDLEVLTWLSSYTANGRCRLSVRAIARQLQHALDVPVVKGERVFEEKVEKVRNAVHSLAKQDAIRIHGNLRNRQGKHLRRVRKEWTSSIELAEALRSDVTTERIGPANTGI